MSARTRRTAPAATITHQSLKFSAINGIMLAVGLLTIVAGYVLLSHGSTVAAPLLLVLGYAVIVPVGVII
jgi:uncharacterized membrane protein HdeD (DUF308 family)